MCDKNTYFNRNPSPNPERCDIKILKWIHRSAHRMLSANNTLPHGIRNRPHYDFVLFLSFFSNISIFVHILAFRFVVETRIAAHTILMILLLIHQRNGYYHRIYEIFFYRHILINSSWLSRYQCEKYASASTTRTHTTIKGMSWISCHSSHQRAHTHTHSETTSRNVVQQHIFCELITSDIFSFCLSFLIMCSFTTCSRECHVA